MNSEGTKFIEFCIKEDLKGDYTYTSCVRASTIDYIIVTENLIEKVKKFLK